MKLGKINKLFNNKGCVNFSQKYWEKKEGGIYIYE